MENKSQSSTQRYITAHGVYYLLVYMEYLLVGSQYKIVGNYKLVTVKDSLKYDIVRLLLI